MDKIPVVRYSQLTNTQKLVAAVLMKRGNPACFRFAVNRFNKVIALFSRDDRMIAPARQGGTERTFEQT